MDIQYIQSIPRPGALLAIPGQTRLAWGCFSARAPNAPGLESPLMPARGLDCSYVQFTSTAVDLILESNELGIAKGKVLLAKHDRFLPHVTLSSKSPSPKYPPKEVWLSQSRSWRAQHRSQSCLDKCGLSHRIDHPGRTKQRCSQPSITRHWRDIGKIAC